MCSGRIGMRHTHVGKWAENAKLFVQSEVDENSVKSDECVCNVCFVDVKRCMSKKNNGEVYELYCFKGKISLCKCAIPSCTDAVKNQKHPFTWNDICSATGIARLSSTDDVPSSLCNRHYQLAYHMLNARDDSIQCHVCGVNRKHHKYTAAQRFSPCPNPKKVEAYLRDTAGYTDKISENDLLCYNWYKYLSQLLKSDVCMLSSDDVLQELECKEKYLVDKNSEFLCTSEESYRHCAVYKTALVASRLLSSEQAFVFNTIYHEFVSNIPEDLRKNIQASKYKYKLLSFLGSEFGQLLSSFCHHRRTGTVFHRAKADLSVLLSNALSNPPTHLPPVSFSNFNDSVHRVINHIVSAYNCDEESVMLDIDVFIDTVCTVAPELWEHVCSLTKSFN